jgi:murein DD-endopeptidase MepM/ murein hydrolase activator NlpD
MRRAAAALLALAGCVPAERPAAPVSVPMPVQTPLPPLQPIRVEGLARQGGALLGVVPLGTSSLALDGTGIPFASDRRFLVAFDRDAAPSATLVATLGDGRQVRLPLTVSAGDWRIERVDAPLRAGKTDAEFAVLRPPELARIAAARAVDHEADGWRQRFVWPAEGRHSGRFGAQRVYQGVPASYHTGADVAVPTGTPVRAPADGVVALASGPFTLEGNLVIVDHGMGLTSAFLHLSRIDVRVGDRVRQGDPLGLSGATGRATGPHLHWGVTWRGRRLDPALLAGE